MLRLPIIFENAHDVEKQQQSEVAAMNVTITVGVFEWLKPSKIAQCVPEFAKCNQQDVPYEILFISLPTSFNFSFSYWRTDDRHILTQGKITVYDKGAWLVLWHFNAWWHHAHLLTLAIISENMHFVENNNNLKQSCQKHSNHWWMAVWMAEVLQTFQCVQRLQL